MGSGPMGDWDDPATQAAARMLFLLAGVSYYKTTAARVIDLGSTTSTPDERAFLTRYYVHGLGEFAYRNNIELSDLVVEGPDAASSPATSPPRYIPTPGRPLIPFGGGIDSIVTVAACAPARWRRPMQRCASSTRPETVSPPSRTRRR